MTLWEEETRVVIIGAGIVGTSTAYCLAKKGEKDVIIVEREEIASEASGANTASIVPCNIQPFRRKAPMIGLWNATHKALTQFNEGLGRDIEYATPRITVVEGQHLNTYESYIREMRYLGFTGLRLIGEEEISASEPYMTPKKHALYDPDGGQVNSLYLTTALGDAARRLGVKIFEGTKVLGIEQDKGRARAVITDKGKIRAEYIVNAAGFWATHVGQMLGLKIPITPLLAQMVVTEELPIRIIKSGSISISSYAVAEQTMKTLKAFPAYKQTKRGNLLLGVTESPGDNKWTTFDAITALCQLALQDFPILRDIGVNVIRTYANLYAMTPDRLPILGSVGGIKGLIMACGLNDYGMSLGYGVGEVVSDMICFGTPPFPIDEFSLSRFAQ